MNTMNRVKPLRPPHAQLLEVLRREGREGAPGGCVFRPGGVRRAIGKPEAADKRCEAQPLTPLSRSRSTSPSSPAEPWIVEPSEEARDLGHVAL